jgi:dTDP-4-amino-4,6-dideoxygalactose transaminase
MTHFYQKELKYHCNLPATQEAAGQVLTLPMHPSLQIQEMDYITNTIREFFSDRRSEK